MHFPSRVEPTPGVAAWPKNRLRFGVTTQEGKTSLARQFATMDLPCYLIAIEIESPAVALLKLR
jgi:hypothetical protein